MTVELVVLEVVEERGVEFFGRAYGLLMMDKGGGDGRFRFPGGSSLGVVFVGFRPCLSLFLGDGPLEDDRLDDEGCGPGEKSAPPVNWVDAMVESDRCRKGNERDSQY